MIGFIENFDSFSYNLVHYLCYGGVEVNVFENHNLVSRWEELKKCDAFLIGPGPNEPENSGELPIIINQLIALKKPILGVCLGHQALGEFFGWKLRRAVLPVHGKISMIVHSGNGLFKGIEMPMPVGRYHSLVIDDSDVKSDLIQVTARSEDGEIMAFEHLELPIWGVQFHPESVLTPNGQELLNNWLNLARIDLTSKPSSF